MSTSVVAVLGNYQAVPVPPAIYRPGVIGGFAMYPLDYSTVQPSNMSGSAFEVINGTGVGLTGGCAVVGPSGNQWLYQYMPWPIGSADDESSGMAPGWPVPPAPPNNAQSWLWLTVTVTDGTPAFSFYWNSSATVPNNAGDALIGWVVTRVDPARSIQVLAAWSQNIAWAQRAPGVGAVTILPTVPPPLGAGPGTSGMGPLTLVFNGPQGVLNQPYSGSLAASGGDDSAGYTYSITVSSLPPGLTLNASTGAITGAPTSIGTFTFTAEVADSATPPNTETVSCTIYVATTGALTLTFGPATAIYETTYAGQVAATGGAKPYTWALATGSTLPLGLTLNASSGWITGNPSVVGTFTFSIKVTDSQTPSADVATIACTLVVSAVGAAAPVTEATIGTPYAYYSLDVNGNPVWQAITPGTPPSSDPRWGQSQAMWLATMVLASAIPSTTSGYAGGTIDVYLTPWGAPSQVTVASDGVTMTITAGPNFNIALTTNYCILSTGSGGFLNQIKSYTSATVAVLENAVAAGVYSFIPAECRTLMDADTVVIDAFNGNAETFQVVSEIAGNPLSYGYNGGAGSWTAHLQLQRTAGAHPAHSGVTQPATYSTPYAIGASNPFVMAIGGGVDADEWAGSLEPGKTQAVSPEYSVGDPSAYMVLLVGETVTGQQNQWPTSTTPHSAVPVAVEQQQPQTLSAKALVPTEISAIVQDVAGNLGELLYDPSFEQQGAGTSSAWVGSTAGAGSLSEVVNASVLGLPFPGPHSGEYCWELWPYGSGPGIYAGLLETLPCTGGQTYNFSVYVASAIATGMCVLYVNWWTGPNATGSLIGPGSVWGVVSGINTTTPSWPAGPAAGSLVAPLNAVSCQVGAYSNTPGIYWLDDWSMVAAPATTGPLSINSAGDIQLNALGVTNAYLAAQAVQANNMAAASITAANAALAEEAVEAKNVASVYADDVEADSSVLGSLIAGSVTITLDLTTGGSIVSAHGASYVGINALGHALVASNTSTGVTTVLDDGYVYSYATYYSGATTTNVSGYFGETVIGAGSLSAFAMELAATAVEGSTVYESTLEADVNGGAANLSLSWSGGGSAYEILLQAGLFGAYLQLPASAAPPGGPGIIYFDGTHYWGWTGSAYSQLD